MIARRAVSAAVPASARGCRRRPTGQPKGRESVCERKAHNTHTRTHTFSSLLFSSLLFSSLLSVPRLSARLRSTHSTRMLRLAPTARRCASAPHTRLWATRPSVARARHSCPLWRSRRSCTGACVVCVACCVLRVCACCVCVCVCVCVCDLDVTQTWFAKQTKNDMQTFA